MKISEENLDDYDVDVENYDENQTHRKNSSDSDINN